MMPSWKLIARQVAEHIWQNNTTISLSRATEIWLADNSHDLTSDTVLGNFDRLAVLVSNLISQRIAESDLRGVTPKYRFSSVTPDLIISQINTNEDTLRSDILKAVGNLSWRAFEHLCAYLMHIAGTSQCVATSAGRDGGIDIVGVLKLNKLNKLNNSSMWHNTQIRVLGQAKHSRLTVTEEKVRLFDKDMSDFSRGEGRAFADAPYWAQNIHMAQIGFIFTLNNFTKGAKDYAVTHSISLKDGEQIVQDLLILDVKTPGLVRYSHHVEFNEHNFLTHFELC